MPGSPPKIGRLAAPHLPRRGLALCARGRCREGFSRQVMCPYGSMYVENPLEAVCIQMGMDQYLLIPFLGE